MAVLAVACGRDPTGLRAPVQSNLPAPPSTPNLEGEYHRLDMLGAVTCTPHRPPSGGTVILDAFTMSAIVRIEQTGSRITLTDLGAPEAPVDTGTVDPAGRVTFGGRFTFREARREGNRQFFVDLTIRATLERVDGSQRLVGPITYENVFREGDPGADVFSTCTRTGIVELARLGDVAARPLTEAVPRVAQSTAGDGPRFGRVMGRDGMMARRGHRA